MFQNLTDFAYTRSAKEAIGFYIVYLVFITLVVGLLGSLIGTVTTKDEVEAFDLGVRVGTVVSVIVSLVLSIMILHAKKLTKDIGLIMLVIVSGIIASFVGGLGGLIVVAYLTTRNTREEGDAVAHDSSQTYEAPAEYYSSDGGGGGGGGDGD